MAIKRHHSVSKSKYLFQDLPSFNCVVIKFLVLLHALWHSPHLRWELQVNNAHPKTLSIVRFEPSTALYIKYKPSIIGNVPIRDLSKVVYYTFKLSYTQALLTDAYQLAIWNYAGAVEMTSCFTVVVPL